MVDTLNKLRIAVRGTANNPATGAPEIAGTTHVGQTLTANAGTGGNAFADDDGLPTTAFPTGYTFQWVRFDSDGTSNRTEISGATSRTYILADDDAGKTVKVEVSFTDRAGFSETLSSAASSAILASQAPRRPSPRPRATPRSRSPGRPPPTTAARPSPNTSTATPRGPRWRIP